MENSKLNSLHYKDISISPQETDYRDIMFGDITAIGVLK